MAWYRLYVNSVGNGAICEGPIECSDEDVAMYVVRNMAIEDYEMFEGYHGIPDMGDIMDAKEDYGLSKDASGDECWDTYYEQRESWLDYWVEEASGPDDIDEDYQ